MKPTKRKLVYHLEAESKEFQSEVYSPRQRTAFTRPSVVEKGEVEKNKYVKEWFDRVLERERCSVSKNSGLEQGQFPGNKE